MTEYLLVGVLHEGAAVESKGTHGLMTSACNKAFGALVAPKITSKSLVFLEGARVPSLQRPGDRYYEYLLEGLMPGLGSVRPTLGGIDYRCRFTESEREADEELIELWKAVLHQSFEVNYRPKTSEEMRDKIRSGDYGCRQIRRVSPEEREIGRRVSAMQRKFDRLHVEAMRKAQGRVDLCIAVLGASHCAGIALKTDWEFCNLAPPGISYLAYVGFYVCPRMAIDNTD